LPPTIQTNLNRGNAWVHKSKLEEREVVEGPADRIGRGAEEEAEVLATDKTC